MKSIFRHILTAGMVVGAVVLSSDAYLGKDTVYEKFEYDVKEAPLLSLSLRALDEGETPYLVSLASNVLDIVSGEKILVVTDNDNSDETDKSVDEEKNVAASANDLEASANSIPASSNDIPELPAEGVASANDYSEINPAEVGSANTIGEQDEAYVMTSVDDSYFDDVLFIGDSRTVGLSEYCQELMDRATFYAKVSMTIYGFDKNEFVVVPTKEYQDVEVADDDSVPTEKVTIEEALNRKQFGKIYIMLGVNELGSGTAETFCNKYGEVIEKIKAAQPDSIIIIQGIMHVTGAKSRKEKIFNNDNINERNEGLKALADGKKVFYIDMNEATDDENGALDKELSFDDVHLKAKSYALWYDYLKNHAYVKMNVSELEQ